MKKVLGVLNAFRRTLSGENKTGEAIHGVLDLLPIPNQIVAKVFKAIGKKGSEAKLELKDALTVRNIAALALTIAIAAGWIGLDQVKQLVNIFAMIVEFLASAGI